MRNSQRGGAGTLRPFLQGATVEKRFANKAAILAAQDLPVAEMEVPEWGAWVRVRTLTAGERDTFESEVVQNNGRNTRTNTRNIRAKLVAACLVDEDGRPLFGLADVEALSAKSAKAMDRIFGKAAELCGMREADVQELAENFAGTPADG